MLPAEIQVKYGREFRRCLLTLDVSGMMRLWATAAPHLPQHSPADTLCSMHMARVTMRAIPRRHKIYSRDFLLERGIEHKNGKWRVGPPPTVISESVGIASRSSIPGLSKRIVSSMEDALLNGIAKGITEPPMQKELMLKARAKVKFKLRLT